MSNGSSSKSLGTFAAGVALGVVLGGGGTYLLLKHAAVDEEPPIRVKGGSIDADVLASAGGPEWQDDSGNGTQWSLTSDVENANEVYDLTWAINASHCGTPPAQAKWIKVEHGTQWIRIQHQLKRSKLIAQLGLSHQSDRRRVRHGGSAEERVTAIEVKPPAGAVWRCELAAKAEFTAVCLGNGACAADWQTAPPQ